MANEFKYSKVRRITDEIRIHGLVNGEIFDDVFDIVIIANGAQSQIRPKHWVKIDKPYPWGAKWTIVPECTSMDTQVVHQFYDQAKIMLGIHPTGTVPSQPNQRLSSIFWSLPKNQLGNFLNDNQARSDWLKQVAQRWKSAADWLEQVVANPEEKQQWLSAIYRDVVMSKFGEGRIGVIGDAAHAMSPQLGQGANMALLDAWALSKSVESSRNNETIDWVKLWQAYHQHRQSSTNFYQFLSRLLTPLYQSEHWWTGPLRDFSFGWMYRIPYFRKEMALTVSGLKSGMFTHMQYQDIASNQNIAPAFSVNESVKIE